VKRSKIDPSLRRSRGSKGAPKRLRGPDTDPGFFEPPTFEWASALMNGTLPAHTFNGGCQAPSEMSEPDLLTLHLMSAGNFSREEAESWARMI